MPNNECIFTNILALSNKMKANSFGSQPIMYILFCALTQLGCTAQQKNVATVGSQIITQAMVDAREKVSKIYYPKEASAVGLSQLIRFYTYAEIMRIHGRPVLPDALEQEEKRIEAQSRDRASLEKIKAIFGNDHDLYVQTFILPNYVDRIFYYDFFLQDPAIQQSLKIKAETFYLAASAHPEQMIALAKKAGLAVQKVILDSATGLVWSPLQEEGKQGPEEMGGKSLQLIDQSQKDENQIKLEQDMARQQNSQKIEQAQKWLNEIVARTTPGKLFASLVDMNESWLILRYIGPEMSTKNLAKSKARHIFHAVSVAKLDFSKWILEEEKKVVIRRE